jgi:hypothetical protein
VHPPYIYIFSRGWSAHTHRWNFSQSQQGLQVNRRNPGSQIDVVGEVIRGNGIQ